MLDNKILTMRSLFCAVRNSNLTGWSSWKIKRPVTNFHCWHPVVLCNHKKEHTRKTTWTKHHHKCKNWMHWKEKT